MPTDLGFMAAPMAACLIITGILCYFGTHVLRRGVIFVDLALAQIAALGTTLAFYQGHDPRSGAAYVFSLIFTFIGAGIFSIAKPREEKIPQEAIIGITFAVASGLSILLVDMARDPHGAEKIQYLMVGSIVWVTWPEIARTGLVCLGVGAFHYLFRRRMLMVSFEPWRAKEEGVSIPLWDLAFYISFGIVITVIVRLAGVILVFSYLIIPAVCAALFVSRLASRLTLGWCIGISVSFVGLLFSYNRPSGPTIVSIFGLCLILMGVVRYVTSARNKVRAVGFTLAGALFLTAVFGGMHLYTLRTLDHQGEEVEHQEGRGLPASENKGEVQNLAAQLADPDSLVREEAIEGLSEIERKKAVPLLHEALTREEDEGLRLKILKALCRFGDKHGIEGMIDILSSGRIPFVRLEALEHLQRVSGESFGYDPLSGPESNEEAIRRWMEWWDANREDIYWDATSRSFKMP